MNVEKWQQQKKEFFYVIKETFDDKRKDRRTLFLNWGKGKPFQDGKLKNVDIEPNSSILSIMGRQRDSHLPNGKSINKLRGPSYRGRQGKGKVGGGTPICTVERKSHQVGRIVSGQNKGGKDMFWARSG